MTSHLIQAKIKKKVGDGPVETLISIISYFLLVVSFIFTLVGSELKKKIESG